MGSNKLNYLRILVLLFFAHSYHAFSQNQGISGADLTYKYVGAGSYEFTLAVYHDCSAPLVLDITQTINYTSSCGLFGSFPAKATNFELIKLCKQGLSECEGGNIRSIEKKIYIGTVTLPSPCADYKFQWTGANRTKNTNTFVPGVAGIYIEALLNTLDASGNSSPQFNADPASFIFLNAETVYNPAVTEENNDDLSYSLIKPKKSTTVDLVYKAPFTESMPFTAAKPLNINTLTGDITIFPINNTITGSIDTTNTVIKITEKRGGKIIGYVMRDMQMEVTKNTNALPVLGGIDGTNNFSISGNNCTGKAISFNVFATSASNKPLTLSLVSNLPNSSLYSESRSGTVSGIFTWIPDSPGQYSISIKVSDGNCPIEGYDIKSYSINILQSPSISFNAPPLTYVADCKNLNLPDLVATVTGGSAPYSFTWASSKGSITSTSDNIPISEPLVYYANVTDANGCSVSDSVNYQSNLIALFEFPSDSGCAGSNIPFNNLSTNVNRDVSITGYSWDFGDGSPTQTVKNPVHSYTTFNTYPVKLSVSSSDGCSTTYLKQVKVYETPSILSLEFKKRCFNSGNQGGGIEIINTTTLSGENASDIPNIKYSWKLNPQNSTNTQASPTFYLPESFTITTTSVTLTATLNGCSSKFSTTVGINPRPKISYLTSKFFPKCNAPNYPKDTLVIVANPIGEAQTIRNSLKYVWKNKTLASDGTNDTLPINLSKSNVEQIYAISVIDTLQCQRDSVVIVGDSLQPSFSTLNYSCKPGDIVVLKNNSLVRDSANVSTISSWDYRNGSPVLSFTGFGPITIQPAFTLADTIRRVKLTIKDKFSCIDTFSTLVVYNTFPNLSKFENSPDKLCYGYPVSLKSPTGKFINWWVWEYGDGTTDTSYNYRTFTQSNALNNIYAIDNGVTVYADTAYNVSKSYGISVNQAGSFPVKVTVSYNNGSVLNTPIQTKQLSAGCTTSLGVNIVEYTPLKYTINTDNYNKCAGDTTVFTAVRSPASLFTVRLSKFTWSFYKTNFNQTYQYFPPLIGVDSTVTKQVFMDHGSKYFGRNQYIVRLSVIDTEGCTGDDTKEFENISITGIKLGNIDVQCQNQNVELFYENQDGIATAKSINKWYIPEQDTTIIANDRINYKFPPSKNSVHTITAQVFGKDSTIILGQKIALGHDKCSSTFNFIYSTKNAPKAEIQTVDKICLQDTVTITPAVTSFYNTSPGLIRTFLSFNGKKTADSTTKTSFKYLFDKSGTNTIKLIAIDTSKCADTVYKSVIVHERPKANFIVSAPNDTTNHVVFVDEDIQFTIDSSTVDYNSTDLQTKWYWGNGDSLILGNIYQNPIYRYPVSDIYTVKLVIKNTAQCADSIQKKVDLTVSLKEVNAFSPNGDDNNDYFFPPINGIKEVEVFRIYNRWGQIVHTFSGKINFTAGDSWDHAKWDGTHNGSAQPVGSYIYFLKVKSGRDEVKTSNGNLTLIR